MLMSVNVWKRVIHKIIFVYTSFKICVLMFDVIYIYCIYVFHVTVLFSYYLPHYFSVDGVLLLCG